MNLLTRIVSARWTSSVGTEHVFGLDPLIELFFRQEAEFQGRVFQRAALLVRRLGDLGRLQQSHPPVQKISRITEQNFGRYVEVVGSCEPCRSPCAD